ncbi:MAG: LysM peptidoglycan-binding domain-containing protein [Bacillota bacterium]
MSHTVRPGESLYLIAQLYHVDWRDIANANGIMSPYNIYPGQVLIIPVGGPPKGGTCHHHVVQKGESLYMIATYYGTTWQTLAAMNHIKNPDLINPGLLLKIPC